MARPRKDGVDYFPFDVDFFDDQKIRLLSARYGTDGMMLYIYLLTEIYRDKGYYMNWRKGDSEYLISRTLGFGSTDKVGQIMAYLLGRSMLFDSKLFRSAEVLSSKGIQRRFQQAVKGRAVKNPVEVRWDLWLLDSEETESFIKVRRREDFSENNPDFSMNNPHNSENYTTNQSKVNQSKVNQSKVKHIISDPPARENAAPAVDDDYDDAQKGCFYDNADIVPTDIGSHEGKAENGSTAHNRPHSGRTEDSITAHIEKAILGRRMNAQEAAELADIRAQYTTDELINAVQKTARRSGRSMAYLRKVLEGKPKEATKTEQPKYQRLFP